MSKFTKEQLAFLEDKIVLGEKDGKPFIRRIKGDVVDVWGNVACARSAYIVLGNVGEIKGDVGDVAGNAGYIRGDAECVFGDVGEVGGYVGRGGWGADDVGEVGGYVGRVGWGADSVGGKVKEKEQEDE